MSPITVLRTSTALALCVVATSAMAQETSITIATVNNGDMIRMQGLTEVFNEAHPDITVEWVTLEENVLRQNVTTDIARGAASTTLSPSAPTRFRSGVRAAGLSRSMT